MKTSLIASVAALLCVAVGCSSPSEEAAETNESSIRAMASDEVLGEIIYGETIDVDYTPAPKYRAFWFMGERGDQIQAQIVSRDMTDPGVWLADADFNTISSNNDTRATDLNALLNGRILPKTGKYYLVFREMNSAPRAKFSVTLRNLGRMPLDCDPDGEGVALPECIDPLEYDPFSPTSCAGTALTAATAATKFNVTGGFRLPEAKIFYRTRQCSVAGGSSPQCSPWVRAHGMDVRLSTVAAAPAPATNAWSFVTADTTRKVKVGFSVQPAAQATQFCVDGPFTNLRGSDWTPLADGTPGVCGAATATMTALCARFEPKPILIESGNPDYYTELTAVLYARY